MATLRLTFDCGAVVDLFQDQFDKLKLGLAVDILEVNMARPGLTHVVVLRQVNRLADSLYCGHEGACLFCRCFFCGFQVFDAVSVNLKSLLGESDSAIM